MEITMYDTLLQLPLFQGLCKNDFTSILGKVKLHFRKYNADEIIVEQGEPCTELIFLLNGEISSQIVDEQKSYSLHETFGSPFVLEPYSLFGMHPNYIATYRARTDLNLVSIDKAFVLSELNNYEIFRLNYLNILSNRAQIAYNKLWNSYIGSPKEKIINFILSRSMYNPQIQISAESETKRSIFREKDKTKRSKKESAQHSKSRNKSFVMTSVSAL